MKKVIGGSVYNTDTARKVGQWDNGKLDGPEWGRETLYQTKSGRYFLRFAGGPDSEHAEVAADGQRSRGVRLQPISPSDAAAWAADRMSPQQFSAEFGPPANPKELEQLNLSIPAGVKSKLERMKAETGKSISQIVSEKFAD